MTRTEVFQNLASDAPDDRMYVALLQGIERTPKGGTVISSCMYFFGSTSNEAAGKSADFILAEITKAAEAEKRMAEMSKRMRKAS